MGESFFSQNMTIATTFFIISFPCVGIWLMFGSMLRQFLDNAAYLRWFNITMSLLLVGSVLPVVKDIWYQF
jgi:threonine/homoserine/homoserine lactone efflux protein